MTPSDRFTDGNWLYYSKANVSIKVGFNLILPVDRYRNWRMMCNRFSIWIDT